MTGDKLLGRHAHERRCSCFDCTNPGDTNSQLRQREDRQWRHDTDDEVTDWGRYEWGSLTDE